MSISWGRLYARSSSETNDGAGAGCIINLSSINAVTPGPNVGLYAATKAAVHNLTILQALEWGPMGLRVNAIALDLLMRECPRRFLSKRRFEKSGQVAFRSSDWVRQMTW